MKAMLIDADKQFVWSDVAEPVLTDEGVIVEIYAAALNRADLLQRQGTYPSPAGWPQWPGLELAGKIVAMGRTAERESGYHIGDSVCALVGGGAYAERIALPYQLLLPVPQGMYFSKPLRSPKPIRPVI